LSFAGDGRGCRTVRPAHAPSPSARARGAAVGAGAGGVHEGEEDPAEGALRTERRGVSAAQAVGTLSPGDFRRLVIERGGGGGRRGSSSPQEVGARTPLTESRRGGKGASVWGGCRSVRRQVVYDRGRGGAGARRGGARACGGGRRRLGVRRRQRWPRPQHPSNPRGRGSEASVP
jgi:hypothetical protein